MLNIGAFYNLTTSHLTPCIVLSCEKVTAHEQQKSVKNLLNMRKIKSCPNNSTAHAL